MEQLHQSETLQVLVLKQSQVARGAPRLLQSVSLGCHKAGDEHEGDEVWPEPGERLSGAKKNSLLVFTHSSGNKLI